MCPSVCRLGLCLVLMLLLATPSSLAGPTPTALDELDWLAGSWFGTFAGGHWEVLYTTPVGGEILSINKELRNGKVASIEFERFSIRETEVIMQPYPQGKRADVYLTLTSLDARSRRAVFENPEHDFPNKIVYSRPSEQSLMIEVSGSSRGKPRAFTLSLKAGKATPSSDQ